MLGRVNRISVSTQSMTLSKSPDRKWTISTKHHGDAQQENKRRRSGACSAPCGIGRLVFLFVSRRFLHNRGGGQPRFFYVNLPPIVSQPRRRRNRLLSLLAPLQRENSTAHAVRIGHGEMIGLGRMGKDLRGRIAQLLRARRRRFSRFSPVWKLMVRPFASTFSPWEMPPAPAWFPRAHCPERRSVRPAA